MKANTTRKALILIIILILALPGCKTIYKTPHIVSWNKDQVEMDLSCEARWSKLETCKSKFKRKEAINLANKYCGISKRTAHPAYYWTCAERDSSTYCSTSPNPLYNEELKIGTKETTTCRTSNDCADYHLIYNCIEPCYN